MVKYCMPIIASGREEILDAIASNGESYHYFEVWLDYCECDRLKLVEELSEGYPGRVIFLFRRQNLEEIQMSLEERFELLTSLSGKPILLDLDISTQQDEINYCSTEGLGIDTILSFHNYTETPDSFDEIVREMEEAGAGVYKFSTYCNSESDAVRLLNLQSALKGKGYRHIVLGMGDYGKITRIFGTLWGNEMIFAPLTKDGESAPGQLTRSELESIFGVLG